MVYRTIMPNWQSDRRRAYEESSGSSSSDEDSSCSSSSNEDEVEWGAAKMCKEKPV